IFAGLLTPFDPRDGVLDARLVAPLVRADHPFGTDPIGRDTLSRLLYGARVSLSVGFASVLLAGVAGSLLGLIAGWRGGWTDTLVGPGTPRPGDQPEGTGRQPARRLAPRRARPEASRQPGRIAREPLPPAPPPCAGEGSTSNLTPLSRARVQRGTV